MTDRIGKVLLDYSKYPGQDLYCDGNVEDELLEIVKTYPETDFGKVIQERKEWPLLYHLSPLRENIVDWLPVGRTTKVLEVGSGCGAITGALARKASAVTCVDLSKKRSLINAYRHKDYENITIHVGNFKDIEPTLEADYDYVCLIGVFEYGQGYIGGDTPYEDFLRILMRHLKPGGRIVIAIENKYGLKYFAGCKEDHIGTYFGGIENYACGGGVRTFGRRKLEKIFAACGVSDYHFYYPYPDYKFMTTLYSDGYLPKKGELSNNMRNFDRDRMLLFNEKDAYDGLLEEELFPVFSNSYMVVLGKPFPVQYARYSNDRAPQFQIRTQIDCDENGNLSVTKYPVSKTSEVHVTGMKEAYEALKKRYESSGLTVCDCFLDKEGGTDMACVRFPFVKGTPLSVLLDRCLEQEDEEGFLDYFREFVKRIGYGEGSRVADIDLAFANILVSEETWTLIDYEWTVYKEVPVKELAYRALFCYVQEEPRRKKLPMKQVLCELGITQEEVILCQESEYQFQQYVNGNDRSMAQLREDIGYRIMDPKKWIDRYQDSAHVNCVQIYEDRGTGYSEETSYFVKEAYQGEHLIDFTIPVKGDVKVLRIDPAMDCCIVKLLDMTWNGLSMNRSIRRLLVINGRICEAAEGNGLLPSMVFATSDPNVNLRVDRLNRMEQNQLHVRMEITRIPETMARDMVQKKGGLLGLH